MSSAEKVLRVLLAFSFDQPNRTAESISRSVGLPLSSTYRYLSVLRRSGFVEDGGNDTFKVSPMVVGLAKAACGTQSLTEVARPFMEELSRESGETALLFARSGDRAVCIGRVESIAQVRFAFEIGTALPLDQGAAPKLLLANVPDAERLRIVEQAANGEPALVKDKASLMAELAEIEARGWAETSGEITRDVYAVAATVRSRRKVIGAVSIAGLVYRIAESDHQALRQMVVKTADRLSKAYDASPT